MSQSTIKSLFFIFFITGNILGVAQNNNVIAKIKQRYQINRFYNEVFRNPANMKDYGRYKVSEVKATYFKKEDEANRIQTPSDESSFGVLASSFFPTDSTTTLWGSAEYLNSNQKNIVWNESIDYELIYPYVTADSVGGNFKNENYSFLGGYSKSFKKIDFGIEVYYNARLASRAVDPRVRNISSDIHIKTGVAFKSILESTIGFYGAYQKYTQSNSVEFLSQISRPIVYHLNGLGYFNNVLIGSNLEAFYDGEGFGLGMQFSPLKSKDIWLTIDFKKITIGKFLVDTISTQISNLENNDLEISLTKLFTSKEDVFGVKLNYSYNTKKGLESVISSRSGLGLVVLAQNENYSLRNTVFQLSGVFQRDNQSSLFRLAPYVAYRKYQEDYLLIRSFQYFDYLDKGLKSTYFKNIRNSNAISVFLNLNYRTVINNESLLRNDDRESISNLLLFNNNLLASNFFNAKIGLELTNHIKEDMSFFIGVNGSLTTLHQALNNSITISTGVRF